MNLLFIFFIKKYGEIGKVIKRKVNKMNRKYIAVLAFIFFALSGMAWTVKDSWADGGPRIANFFAAKEMVPGDTWKVFIKASDPDANMKYVYAVIDQAGGNGYPLSITRIKPENQKEISGYLYLNTIMSIQGMDYATLKLTLQIRDDKGRFSEPVVLPLTLLARASEENPPNGVFQDKDLGPIMIQLKPVSNDGRSFGN